MKTKSYVYYYEAGDREYQLIINADNDEEAISLRDQLLSLYANDAARLEESLLRQGIRSSWDYEQSRRETRVKEVETYRERKDRLKLTTEYVLVEKERNNEYYVRRMGYDDQTIAIFIKGEKNPRDQLCLNYTDFPSYSQKVTQKIEKVLNESPVLILLIGAYVTAFNLEVGASQDPIQLELLQLRLYREYFGENSKLGNNGFSYLDKTYSDPFDSVERRVNAAKIDRPHVDANILELPKNSWGMTSLMFAAIRLGGAGSNVDDRVNKVIKRASQLLEDGNNINAQDAYGRTALMYVAMGYRYFHSVGTMPGREKLTQWLLQNGADPSLKDHLGKTALDYFTTEVGIDHRATQLLAKSLLAKSTTHLSISSSLAEPSASSGSIAVGGNRSFFQPSAPASDQPEVLRPGPNNKKAGESIFPSLHQKTR